MKLKGMLKAFTQFSALTALSRVLGLARDISCAHFIGAGVDFDAFLVAFQIPNFMRKLFAEGAMAQAFVPVLSEFQLKYTEFAQKQLIAKAQGMLCLAVAVITIIVWICAPWVVKLYAPGFATGSAKFNLAVSLLYWTFPYLALVSLVAFFSAVLNCKGKFSVAAFAPVLLNISLIVGAYWGSFQNGSVYGLAVAVPIAGSLQLILLLVYSSRFLGFIMPQWGWKDPAIRKMWRLMLGALFGVSIAQISSVIDTALASFLTSGSVSWLYFAQRLVFLPLGLFGVAAATVILPKLSAIKDVGSKQKTIAWAVNLIAALAIPATLGLLILAKPIVISLFNYGKFSSADVVNTQYSVMAMAMGLPAFMLNKIFIAIFYAKQDIKTPIKIGLYSLLVNVLVAIVAMHWLLHIGIALALAVAAWVQLALLVVVMLKQKLFDFKLIKFKSVVIASIIMAALVSSGLLLLQDWFYYSLLLRCGYLCLLLILGLASYGCSLWFLRWRLPVLTL